LEHAPVSVLSGLWIRLPSVSVLGQVLLQVHRVAPFISGLARVAESAYRAMLPLGIVLLTPPYNPLATLLSDFQQWAALPIKV
jgi:hypothetical protein